MAALVFMGSDEISMPSLMALTLAHDIRGVVTQPDRQAGRGRQLIANPVKRFAEGTGLPVCQPESLREQGVFEQLREWAPDVIVVVAYGQILGPEILGLPEHGCINVHASLLPRFRGAAPIPAAIMAGDNETGVTIIKMDKGLDTGPILAQDAAPMEIDDTSAILRARLGELGAQLLVHVLPAYLDGEIAARPQPSEGATYARLLTKADSRIDWTWPAERIDRQVRAYWPWPGTHTMWGGRRLKILEVVPIPDWAGPELPGTVLDQEVCPLVVAGSGAVWLTRVQLAGKRAIAAPDFVRGQPRFLGSLLG